MSVSSISSSSDMYAGSLRSAFQQSRADFQSLGNALQSGDLGAAQKFFAALQQDMQTVQSAREARGDSAQGQSNTMASDFQALSSALKSGDMGAAQKAFDALLKDLQSTHHGRHRQANGAASSKATDADGDSDGSQTASADSAGTSVNTLA